MNCYHLGLALLMLITGSINTLSVKWADTMKSESTDGKLRPFVHPFLQACGMFIGEMSCMIAFFIVRWYNRRKARRQAESRSREEPEESVDRGMTAETPFFAVRLSATGFVRYDGYFHSIHRSHIDLCVFISDA